MISKHEETGAVCAGVAPGHITLIPATVVLENGTGGELTYTVQAAYQNDGTGSANPGAATPFPGTTARFRTSRSRLGVRISRLP